MTLDEAKAILPPELKYPLPADVLDNLLDKKAMMVKLMLNTDDEEEKIMLPMYVCEVAALIELAERRAKLYDLRCDDGE